MEGQRCETCRFYARYDEESAPHVYSGECVRYPPSVPDDGDNLFPQVLSKTWCGEYQPANPETVTEGAATLARLVLLGDLTAARALADKLRE